MIDKVISKINFGIKETFNFPGIKIYGMTQQMRRTEQDGSTTIFPAVVDNGGEGKWVGVDDTAPMSIYHKNINLTLRQAPGYGDEKDSVSTYGNQIIVFFDRSKIEMNPDEIHLFIMARTADQYKMNNFKSIRILFQSVNLNSQAVYQGEYQASELKILPPAFSMIAINYQVESIFSKQCFPVCP